jgi:Cd2+/Zn2+-exporting ATPase
MTEQLEFHVANLDCDHDAAALRRGFQEIRGVSDLQILPTAAKVRIAFDTTATNKAELEAHLRTLGFPPKSKESISSVPPPWRNMKVLTSVGSGVLLLV